MIENAPLGYAVFCDDIRYEAGSKFSLMGVYVGVMFVHADFPITLPKFVIAVTFAEHVSTFAQEPVNIHLYMPGDIEGSPSTVANIPFEEMQRGVDRATFERPGLPPAEYAYSNLQMVFAPFVLQTEGAIRVRAVRGKNSMRLAGLRVLRAEKK